MTPKIVTIYGTRPEAIKVAPVLLALDAREDLDSISVTTGQHRDLLDEVNALFGLRPDIDLDLFSPGQSLNALVSRALAHHDDVFTEVRPDAVLVQGDTSTAFAGALAAFHRGIPVAHLEAGLRTGNLASPFPEEANRRLISQLARLHLAPTTGARDNLLREGVDPQAVVVTGNTVIDALLSITDRDLPFADDRLTALEESGRRILLVTVHRRESWGEPLASVGRALRRIAVSHPDVSIVVPLHPNPVVRRSVVPHLERITNALVIDPLPYGDFARLMRLAHVIVSDSGGVQEEAPSLGKPVLVLRDNTERPEAVSAGTVRLVGTDADRIVEHVNRLLDDPDAYATMAHAMNPYGDGAATGRVVASLTHLLGVGRRVADWAPGLCQGPASDVEGRPLPSA